MTAAISPASAGAAAAISQSRIAHEEAGRGVTAEMDMTTPKWTRGERELTVWPGTMSLPA
jgi:hypothetical protein